MRDLPNIVRIAIVGLLFASLLLILRQCGSGGGYGSVETDASGQKKEAAAALLDEAVFYPAVPGTLPDLNDGYLFNKDRFLDESDLEDASPSGFGADTIDMEALVYSGSIIIGDLRKALVAYQEKVPVVQRGARRNVRTRNQRKPAKGAYKHKQLELGELFMGYRVARIEDNSIVFEKGSERIEKFLFDASKNRVEIKSSPPAAQQRAAKTVSPSSVRTAPQPPQSTGVPPKALTRPTMTRPKSSSESAASAPSRRVRRSQRLLGIDPSFVPPTLPEGTN